MYSGKLTLLGGRERVARDQHIIDIELAEDPSKVPVTRCHPVVTLPPSAHPNILPHVPVEPVPELTMNLYLVPVSLVPR